MRQFILGDNKAYPTAVSAATNGMVGFVYLKNGVPTIDSNGSGITDKGNIVLFRNNENGGNVTIPIYKNNFSYVKGEYQAATKFNATVVIPTSNATGDYSIIIALKGAKFNERNKWTATVHFKESTTSANIASALTAQINNNSENSGVSASVSASTITITANEFGIDYNIICADNLWNVAPTINTIGHPAYGDSNYIINLADQAAAGVGFEYTYRDSSYYLYKNYPINPLNNDNSIDTGFTIFTLKFSEPRETKTTDIAIKQIVQVAFPTGAAAITTFETVCKALAGIATASASIATVSASND